MMDLLILGSFVAVVALLFYMVGWDRGYTRGVVDTCRKKCLR